MPYKDKDKQRTFQRERVAAARAAFMGDKVCVKCGSRENLELDHVDRSSKTSHKIWSWSKGRQLAEIQKCQVLCLTCHRRKSACEAAALAKGNSHGTQARYYDDKCRCVLCVAFYVENLRKRRETDTRKAKPWVFRKRY